MILRRLAFFLFLFSGIGVFAQSLETVDVPEDYYTTVKSQILSVIPTQDEVVNPQKTDVPANLKEILFSRDWYEVGNYFVKSGEFKSEWAGDLTDRENNFVELAFPFLHYGNDGKVYELQLFRKQDNSSFAQYGYFDEGGLEQILEVTKEGDKTFIVSTKFGETQKNEVLSFKDGVLIIKSEAVPGAISSRFHIAFVGVERVF